MLQKAWGAISNQTFTNCFRKSGISEDAEKAMNDEEDPFKELEDDDLEEDSVQTLGADLSILKDLLIKLTLTSHLTNTSISTSKLVHHTVN